MQLHPGGTNARQHPNTSAFKKKRKREKKAVQLEEPEKKQTCGMVKIPAHTLVHKLSHTHTHTHTHLNAHVREHNRANEESYLHTGHVTDISGMHL